MNRLKSQLLLAGCLLCISSQGIANENAVANEFFNGDTLAFDYKANFSNATVSISGPDGYNVSVFQKQGSPTVSLSQFGSLVDGEYNYQISVASEKTVKVTDKGNTGRGKNNKTMMNLGETQSGFFRVKNGAIVNYLDVKESE